MWNELHADFLGVDIFNVVMSEYTNPKQVLDACKSGNKPILNEVLGKVINRYKNWSKFSVEDMLNDSGFKFAIDYALDTYHWRTNC